MTPQQLKKALIDAGLTGAEIGRIIGAGRNAICDVLHGRRETPWIRRGIAEQLGMSYLDAWGSPDPGVNHLPRGKAATRTCTR